MYFLLACFDPVVKPDDTDTDTQVDADTDADTDTDTDTDPPGSTLDGTLTLSVTGAPLECGFTNHVTGTSIIGECEGCDFHFDLTPDVRDEWGDCDALLGEYFQVLWAFADGSGITGSEIFQADEFYDPYYAEEGFDSPYVHDAFVHRWTWEGYGYVYTWDSLLAADETPYTTFTWDEGSVAWHLYEQSPTYVPAFTYWEMCGSYDFDYYTTPEATALEGDVPCAPKDGNIPGDIWTGDLLAGDEITASVDTIDPDREAMFSIYVVGPDTCEAAASMWGLGCTGGTEQYCAQSTFTAAQTGTYSFAVANWGHCDTEVGHYGLGVTNATTGEAIPLTESFDDVNLIVTDVYTTTYQIDFEATISP